MSSRRSRTHGSSIPNNWANSPSISYLCVHFAERKVTFCGCARIRSHTCPAWCFACPARTCTRPNEGLWERIADPIEIAPTATGTDTVRVTAIVPVRAGGPSPALSETPATVRRAAVPNAGRPKARMAVRTELAHAARGSGRLRRQVPETSSSPVRVALART